MRLVLSISSIINAYTGHLSQLLIHLDFPAILKHGGLRAEVTFPSCWDGVNLDSADHKSHMAYPGPDGFWESGPCPETHPVRLPTLFFEAIFRTHEVGMEAGDQLVYSFNDWSGYGFHGDFMHGWKEGVIEGFLNYCAYNDGSGPTQCGIVKDKSSQKCI